MIQYVQKGKIINCINNGEEAIIYGSGVIVGNNVFVAEININPGCKGTLSTEGIFLFNTSSEIQAGETVFYNTESDLAFNDLSELSSFEKIGVAGISVSPASGGKVEVKLVQSVLSVQEIKKLRGQAI